jgi:hypothetical protein
MKSAAIGIRVHSGWGALVAVSYDSGRVEVLARRQIVIVDPRISGAQQPYHYAKSRGIHEAEKHLACCTEASGSLARMAIHEIAGELHERKYRVAGAAILLAAGRPLPSLPEILASHPLIHTAEGEFFRRVFREACESEGVRVTGFREHDLAERAKSLLGRAAAPLLRKIARLGRLLGPPWTQDQKTAAIAACLALAKYRR